MTTAEMPITVVVPGDLHLTEPVQDNYAAACRMVEEVNTLVRPDFVQFIGDNVQDATEAQFRLFDGLRSRLAVPHFALVGDHDVKDDPEARGFRAHVGETHGSTTLRGFRFLRLDTQQARPPGLSPGQVDWLRGEVDAAQAAGERVVVFQHNDPYQIWEDFAGPGVDNWRAIVQTRPIRAIICGHTHYGQVANDGRNVTIATRSIGDPEGGPPGYAVVHLHGEDLALGDRSVEDRGPLVLVTHPRELILATGPRHVVSGPDLFRVRAWSATPLAEVRGRVDDGDWSPLDPLGPGGWSAPLPFDRLKKGVHAFEAEAVDRDGLFSSRRIEFAVDPSGRFTAVPAVHPVVTGTKFC